MGIEISLSTNYYPPSNRELTLSNPSSRRDLGPVDGKTFEAAVEIATGLGLTPFGKVYRGKIRILETYGGTLDLRGYGRGLDNYMRLGFAVEYSRNPDATGEPVPRTIIVRESKMFNEEAFAQGANRLLKYNEISNWPRWLRGDRVYAAGLAAGIIVGAGSLMAYGSYYHYDFDNITLATAASAGAVAGYKFGEHRYKLDQWALKRRVPDLEQYYGNDKALERLEKIAGHLETVKILTKIEGILKMQGVDLTRDQIGHRWRTGPDASLGRLVKKYNDLTQGEESEDKDKVKAELVDTMVEWIKAAA